VEDIMQALVAELKRLLHMNRKSIQREIDRVELAQNHINDLTMERLRGTHYNEVLERRAIDAKISSMLRKKKE
jgi:hypothetical protein